MINKRLGIIGCGNMGEAIIRGVLCTRLVNRKDIYATDISRERLRYIKRRYGVNICKDVNDLIKSARVLLLCIKPCDAQGAIEGIRPAKGSLFISIMAGIKTGYIEKALGGAARVVRVMPNMPLIVGEGMSCISRGRHATAGDILLAKRIFAGAGDALRVEEASLDAVTAVSGSGPAYFFYFVEALLEAGVACGLAERTSERLVYQTAKGAVKLLLDSKNKPGSLRAAVTSKGGTTEAAIGVLEKGGFKALIRAAVVKAMARSKEMSKRCS